VPRERRVPAAHDEIDGGISRRLAYVFNRIQRHQEIADTLESKEQDAPGRHVWRPPPSADERRDRPQHQIRGAHQRPLTLVVNLKVIEQ
jgi:hypothetical protein